MNEIENCEDRNPHHHHHHHHHHCFPLSSQQPSKCLGHCCCLFNGSFFKSNTMDKTNEDEEDDDGAGGREESSLSLSWLLLSYSHQRAESSTIQLRFMNKVVARLNVGQQNTSNQNGFFGTITKVGANNNDKYCALFANILLVDKNSHGRNQWRGSSRRIRSKTSSSSNGNVTNNIQESMWQKPHMNVNDYTTTTDNANIECAAETTKRTGTTIIIILTTKKISSLLVANVGYQTKYFYCCCHFNNDTLVDDDGSAGGGDGGGSYGTLIGSLGPNHHTTPNNQNVDDDHRGINSKNFIYDNGEGKPNFQRIIDRCSIHPHRYHQHQQRWPPPISRRLNQQNDGTSSLIQPERQHRNHCVCRHFLLLFAHHPHLNYTDTVQWFDGCWRGHHHWPDKIDHNQNITEDECHDHCGDGDDCALIDGVQHVLIFDRIPNSQSWMNTDCCRCCSHGQQRRKHRRWCWFHQTFSQNSHQSHHELNDDQVPQTSAANRKKKKQRANRRRRKRKHQTCGASVVVKDYCCFHNNSKNQFKTTSISHSSTNHITSSSFPFTFFSLNIKFIKTTDIDLLLLLLLLLQNSSDCDDYFSKKLIDSFIKAQHNSSSHDDNCNKKIKVVENVEKHNYDDDDDQNHESSTTSIINNFYDFNTDQIIYNYIDNVVDSQSTWKNIASTNSQFKNGSIKIHGQRKSSTTKEKEKTTNNILTFTTTTAINKSNNINDHDKVESGHFENKNFDPITFQFSNDLASRSSTKSSTKTRNCGYNQHWYPLDCKNCTKTSTTLVEANKYLRNDNLSKSLQKLWSYYFYLLIFIIIIAVNISSTASSSSSPTLSSSAKFFSTVTSAKNSTEIVTTTTMMPTKLWSFNTTAFTSNNMGTKTTATNSTNAIENNKSSTSFPLKATAGGANTTTTTTTTTTKSIQTSSSASASSKTIIPEVVTSFPFLSILDNSSDGSGDSFNKSYSMPSECSRTATKTKSDSSERVLVDRGDDGQNNDDNDHVKYDSIVMFPTSLRTDSVSNLVQNPIDINDNIDGSSAASMNFDSNNQNDDNRLITTTLIRRIALNLFNHSQTTGLKAGPHPINSEMEPDTFAGTGDYFLIQNNQTVDSDERKTAIKFENLLPKSLINNLIKYSEKFGWNHDQEKAHQPFEPQPGHHQHHHHHHPCLDHDHPPYHLMNSQRRYLRRPQPLPYTNSILSTVYDADGDVEEEVEEEEVEDPDDLNDSGFNNDDNDGDDWWNVDHDQNEISKQSSIPSQVIKESSNNINNEAISSGKMVPSASDGQLIRLMRTIMRSNYNGDNSNNRIENRFSEDDFNSDVDDGETKKTTLTATKSHNELLSKSSTVSKDFASSTMDMDQNVLNHFHLISQENPQHHPKHPKISSSSSTIGRIFRSALDASIIPMVHIGSVQSSALNLNESTIVSDVGKGYFLYPKYANNKNNGTTIHYNNLVVDSHSGPESISINSIEKVLNHHQNDGDPPTISNLLDGFDTAQTLITTTLDTLATNLTAAVTAASVLSSLSSSHNNNDFNNNNNNNSSFASVLIASSTLSPISLPEIDNNNPNETSDPASLLLVNDWLDIVIIVLKVLILGTIIFAAIFGNLLVIIAVFRHHRLRITTNYFIVSLAFADILVALFAMTFNASVVISGKWIFNMIVCDFWNSCDVLFSTASIMHLSCISYDRYYAIIKPLDYPRKVTGKRVAIMLCCVWISSALISYIPIFTGIYTTTEALEARSIYTDQCEWIVNIPYALISSTVSFWLPCGIMLSAYYKIYREAIKQEKFIYRTQQMANQTNHHHHQHHQKSARNSQSQPLQPLNNNNNNSNNNNNNDDLQDENGRLSAPKTSTASENNVIQIQTASSHHRNSHCDGNDPESGSSTPTKRTISKMKREHKAAKTLGIIMGAFILCWLPFFIWYVTSTICGQKCNTPKVIVDLLFWVGYLNSAMNPIIYAYFNRDFREAFKETLRNVFCRCWHLKCLESPRSDAIAFSCTYRSTMDVGLVENKYVKD